MAIAGTNLGGSAANTQSSVNTASISPAANALILIVVSSYVSGGTPNAPTLSGNSLTYVQHDTIQTGNYRVTLFRAMGASPSTGAITISFGGQTQTAITWEMSQFTGVDTTGTNGSGAIKQENNHTASSATSNTTTLSAFSSSANATYGFNFISINAIQTIPSGFTTLDQSSDGGGNIDTANAWNSANVTSVQFTWTGSATGIGIAAELTAQNLSDLLASDI